MASTDDEKAKEEDKQPQPWRRPKITSGKLRTVGTIAVNHVIWHHELDFTLDGQPAAYQSVSCMAFVNSYLSIMAQQTDIIRNQMATHSQKLMEDGEIFEWLVV